nr:DEAD/DEAH box helicase [Caldilineaceae bacterium]
VHPLTLTLTQKMTLPALLSDLQRDPGFMANVVAWETIPARAADFSLFSKELHPALTGALGARGIDRLYSHQSLAVDHALAGRNVTVVTPTASGKTLCYNLPVLHTLLTDPTAKALYLFPTKALAQDQLAELQELRLKIEDQRLKIGDHANLPISQSPNLPPENLQSSIFNLPLSTYDGDTPTAQRAAIRKTSRLIITNPDMLHTAILPYHTQWQDFLGGLRYIVIDEMHVYRGVFGSHVANVLRRLRRLCDFYGAHPQVICASATIANPGQLAERLTEQPTVLITENGAPRGEKHIVLYNPPIYDQESGLRRSGVLETQEIAARCVLAGVQTITFARSRLTTEVLLTYLRERIRRSPQSLIPNPQSLIRGYRGGYLPSERRAIEAGLRDGSVRGVVTTNALELGIDIGQLQAAVLCGYPGTIASTWQQMGRAGRTQESALAILVATGLPLDQFIIQHPDFIFGRSPEHALINPDNLMLLVDHLRCAAYEMPFEVGERLGNCEFTGAALDLLAEQGDVQRHGERYFWTHDSYPARSVSLRSAGGETVLIQARYPDGAVSVIGEVDVESAPLLLHTGAVYIHEGQSHVVESLDLAQHLAVVVAVNVDYYTVVDTDMAVEVLAVHERKRVAGAEVCHGEVLVRSQVVSFRKIKHMTHEMLGVTPLDYPPNELETTAYWLSVLPETQAALEEAGLWHDSENDYGPNWQEQRAKVRARDGYCCTQCGVPEAQGRQHDVHHVRPFRTFGYVPGGNEHYRLANQTSNLVLVCRRCHQRLEAGVRTRSGLNGLEYALGNIAPFHLMCDRGDLGVYAQRAQGEGKRQSAKGKSGGELPDANGNSDLATLFIFERIAAGLGFSLRLFEMHGDLLAQGEELVRRCPCADGCPACVGPVLENELASLETKRLTLALLGALRAGKVEQGVAGKATHGDIQPRGLAADVQFQF